MTSGTCPTEIIQKVKSSLGLFKSWSNFSWNNNKVKAKYNIIKICINLEINNSKLILVRELNLHWQQKHFWISKAKEYFT